MVFKKNLVCYLMSCHGFWITEGIGLVSTGILTGGRRVFSLESLNNEYRMAILNILNLLGYKTTFRKWGRKTVLVSKLGSTTNRELNDKLNFLLSNMGPDKAVQILGKSALRIRPENRTKLRKIIAHKDILSLLLFLDLEMNAHIYI